MSSLIYWNTKIKPYQKLYLLKHIFSIIYWNFVHYMYHTRWNAVNCLNCLICLNCLNCFTVLHRIKLYSTTECNVNFFLIYFPPSLAEIKNQECLHLWNWSQHYRPKWRSVLPTNVSYVTSHKNIIKCQSLKYVPESSKPNTSAGLSSSLLTIPLHKVLDKINGLVKTHKTTHCILCSD
jgi:hypothetical protein